VYNGCPECRVAKIRAAARQATHRKNEKRGGWHGVGNPVVEVVLHRLKQLFRRPSFRDVFMGQQTVIPFTGHIEVAVTGAEFPDIRFPVDARADYVIILVPIAGCQPAGTGHIAVTIPVQQQGIEQLDHPLVVPIETVPFRFLHAA
jgi:hypothetical protein